MFTLPFSYLWGFGKNPKGLGEQQEAPLRHPPSLSIAVSHSCLVRSSLWQGGQAQVTVKSPSCLPPAAWNTNTEYSMQQERLLEFLFPVWLQNNPTQRRRSPVLGQVCSESGHLLGLPCSLINHLANKNPQKAGRQPHIPQFSNHLEDQVVLPEHPNNYEMLETSGLCDGTSQTTVHGNLSIKKINICQPKKLK